MPRARAGAQYAVAEILGRRYNANVLEYLIKWEGDNQGDPWPDSWQPAYGVQSAELVKEFEERADSQNGKEFNDSLFGQAGARMTDEGDTSAMSRLGWQAQYRLTSAELIQMRLDVGNFAVCLKDKAGYYRGQIANVCQIRTTDGRNRRRRPSMDELYMDIGVGGTGIPVPMERRRAEQLFYKLSVTREDHDELLIDRDEIVQNAQDRLLKTRPQFTHRVSNYVAAYNEAVKSRSADVYFAGGNPTLLARTVYALPAVRNLQHARNAGGLTHPNTTQSNDGDYTAAWAQDAMSISVSAGSGAYSSEMVSATANTAGDLYDHYVDNNLGAEDNNAELERFSAQIGEQNNPGGVFPVSTAKTLSQVKLGNLPGLKQQWGTESTMEGGGWTFWAAVPTAPGSAGGRLTVSGNAKSKAEMREYVKNVWSPLDLKRDAVTRHRDNVERVAMWTRLGSDAHAKCFMRALLRKPGALDDDPIVPTPQQQLMKLIDDSKDDNVQLEEAVLVKLPMWTDGAREIIEKDWKMFSQMLQPPPVQWGPDVEAQMKEAHAAILQKEVVVQDNLVLPTIEGMRGRRLHRRRLVDNYNLQADGPLWFESSSDTRPLAEHFADNARSTLEAFVECNKHTFAASDPATPIDVRLSDLAVEFPVYWPFGMHQVGSKASARTSPFETRVDAIVQLDFTNSGQLPILHAQRTGPVLLVEYKMRMENDKGHIYPWSDARAKQQFSGNVTLSGTSDRRQAELNAWMLYLNTGILATHALVVQATRRRLQTEVAKDLEEADRRGSSAKHTADNLRRIIGDDVKSYGGQVDDTPFGYVACLTLDWGSAYMQAMIQRFARKPYGGSLTNSAVYADYRFLIPDLDKFEEEMGPLHTILPGAELPMAMEVAKMAADNLLRKKQYKTITMPNVDVDLPRETFYSDSIIPFLRLAPLKKIAASYLSGLGERMRQFSTYEVDLEDNPSHAYRLAVDMYVVLPMVLHADTDRKRQLCGTDQICAPLLFHNTGGRIEVMCYSCATKVPNIGQTHRKRIQAGAPIPLSGPVFRRTDNLQFRTVQRDDIDTPAECIRLRAKLNRQIGAAATRIEAALRSKFPLQFQSNQGISLANFWKVTVNRVWRRNVAAGGPLLREFAVWSSTERSDEPFGLPPTGVVEPAAEQPQGAPSEGQIILRDAELRRSSLARSHAVLKAGGRNIRGRDEKLRQAGIQECIRRCLHRLINVRLLRASHALAGVTDVDGEHVVDDDDMTAAELQQWLQDEESQDTNADGWGSVPEDSVEGKDWWHMDTKTRRRDWLGERERHARQAVFPHFSQRKAWSEHALHSLFEGNENAVDLAEQHVLDDLCYALSTF